MSNKDEEDEDFIEIKAILVGGSGVGKTNLINVTVGKDFCPASKTTSCCSMVQKNLVINDNKFLINIWDTMGQESYKSISKLFFRDSKIVIFVYDITSYESFKGLEDWINLANSIINEDYICGIVGNKSDLYLERKVPAEEAENYALSKKMKFKLVSAKEYPQEFEDFLIELIKEYKIPERRKKTILKKENQKEDKNKCNC